MAFQQPQRQQPRQSFTTPSQPSVQTTAPPRQQSPPPERQEWILFSPDAPSDTYDRTDSTIQTDHITGRLSDFGSLETGEGTSEQQAHREQEADDDLDSLDDGLHAFNELPVSPSLRRHMEQSGDTVLPAHDGLGMFPGNSDPVQEQFWQHERYNPRRRRMPRRSSLQQTLEEAPSVAQPTEDEKHARIERWRTEQSQAILEEIEKETRRRRRRSRMSVNKTQASTPISQSAPEASIPPVPPSRTEQLSFWERITRRVIRDLIGIDDATLEYLFGESVPEPPPKPMPSAASAIVDYAERAIPNDSQLTSSTSSWEERLLSRIAKELGILFNHISEHPGAFSTYLRTQEIPPYAGLPDPAPAIKVRKSRNSGSPAKERHTAVEDSGFTPTLKHQHHRRHSASTMDPSLWGIEEEDEEPPQFPSPTAEASRVQSEKDYWERDLDVKMVFGFLRNRLLPASSSSAPTSPQPSSMATQPSSQIQANSLRRAALIRHHHPLVARSAVGKSALNTSMNSAPQQQRSSRINIASTGSMLHSSGPLSPILGRRSSRGADTESCASQSTKRSRTARSGRSGSSRNYWDMGGPNGGEGGSAWSAGWGEV